MFITIGHLTPEETAVVLQRERKDEERERGRKRERWEEEGRNTVSLSTVSH